MRRRSLLTVLPLLLAGRAVAATFAPTPQDRATIAAVEAYLNGIKRLKARFLQVAPNGAISGGTMWLDRPGKMRFDYDPPAPFLLVANYGILIYHDKQLDQTSNIPLSQTPLGILLSDRVKLSGDVEVIGIDRQPGEIVVRMQRTGSPGDGSLALGFVDKPVTLRQWTVTDPQRQETRVTLMNPESGGTFDAKLFEFKAPTGAFGGSNG